MFHWSLFCLFAAICAVSGFDGVSHSFRRDHYLPQPMYPERWCDIPTEGGRVHYVASTAKGIEVSLPFTAYLGEVSVDIDDSTDLPKGLDWLHVDYNGITGQIWISFHAHSDDFLSAITSLKVVDATGTIYVDETEAVAINMEDVKMQVTYVTSRNNYQELVVHLHNYESDAQMITAFEVNGVLQPTSEFVVEGNNHMVVVVPVEEMAFSETSIWTITYMMDTGVAVGYGGSLVKELFPLEDWPKSGQCPFPVEGANETNFNLLYDEMSLDTHFMSSNCDAESEDVFEAAAASQGTDRPWFLLPNEGHSDDGPKEDPIPSSYHAGISALSVGDETDSGLDHTEECWHRVLKRKKWYPGLSTYMGGHSNRLNGAFSGIAPIQGMDFYVAACAPHITGMGYGISLSLCCYLRNFCSG